jgi:hypothetical protein
VRKLALGRQRAILARGLLYTQLQDTAHRDQLRAVDFLATLPSRESIVSTHR